MHDQDRGDAPTRFDLQLGEWRFHLNLKRGKLVVSRAQRPELAHLTLSWRNVSGEVDLHLTRDHERAMHDGHLVENYESILRVPRDAVEGLGARVGEASEAFVRDRLRRSWRSYRPGWLARNGYIVTHMEPEALRRALETIAPKQRRKYRVRLDLIENTSWVVEGQDVSFYDPRVLRDHDLISSSRPVHVARMLNGRVERMILKYGRGLDGTFGWWGIGDRDALRGSGRLQAKLLELVGPSIRPEHAEKFERIVSELALEDSPFGRNLAASVRRFIRDARNQEARPVRRAETATSPSP